MNTTALTPCKPKVKRTKLTKLERLKANAAALGERVNASLSAYNNRPRFS